MVAQQIRARGVRDERVLDALERVPRESFIPDDLRHEAHRDCPVPIGHGQTISQPYIVGYMTEALRLESHHRVLEIGTGCG
jgi:protein-L-isoaspartate(D-aspartate) O-methyltransferase